MIATGVAIRDTVQLKRKSIQDGWLRINRQKTGRPVRQHFSTRPLCRELLAGEGEYIFWDGKYQVTSEVTTWQDDLRLLMQDADCGLRGTSRIGSETRLSISGWARGHLTEVAAMLGDTVSSLTERHYANLASSEWKRG